MLVLLHALAHAPALSEALQWRHDHGEQVDVGAIREAHGIHVALRFTV